MIYCEPVIPAQCRLSASVSTHTDAASIMMAMVRVTRYTLGLAHVLLLRLTSMALARVCGTLFGAAPE